MTRDELKIVLFEILSDIAPESDPTQLAPDENLRDALDLDSMDFQSYVARLHERFGVDIPERHYPKFTTIEGALDYLGKLR